MFNIIRDIIHMGCDNMSDEKIIRLQHFFEIDVRIKKGMYSMVPLSMQYFDESTLQKYTDELDDLLTYVFSELKCVAIDIFGKDSKVLARICYLENVIKNKFYLCGFDIDKLKKFYKEYIGNMKLEFINSVKGECIGYAFGGTSSVEMATSINEILHFIHSYVVNNNTILQTIPLLNQKNNKYNYPISLRGIKVPVFEQLFEQFPIELNVGWTDMVAISEKKLIMMVRDRGHALSMEISLNNNVARIEYFIPKLCNIEMINRLPGINKVNKDSIGATGSVEVPINALSETLFNFISKVPSDSDMILETGRSI